MLLSTNSRVPDDVDNEKIVFASDGDFFKTKKWKLSNFLLAIE